MRTTSEEATAEEEKCFDESLELQESNLSFEQRVTCKLQEGAIQMLALQRTMRLEEREAENAEREGEKERQEYERQRASEEEEKSIREEQRLRILRSEKEEYSMREVERQTFSKKPVFMKIQKMGEMENIDDYFRIFEMTAKVESLPQSEWLGNLVPKLTEKAKSVYLEIPDPKYHDYYETKSRIIKAYQLTADHYRFKFRAAEKLPDEDFVQWGNQTRR